MTRSELLRELEDMIGLDSGTLRGREFLNDLCHWDSMQILNFITLVNKKFGLVVDGVTAGKARTVEDLIKLVEPHFTD